MALAERPVDISLHLIPYYEQNCQQYNTNLMHNMHNHEDHATGSIKHAYNTWVLCNDVERANAT